MSERLKNLTNIESSEYNPLFYKVDCLFREGKFNDALTLLDTISKSSPRYDDAMLFKSLIMEIIGDVNQSDIGMDNVSLKLVNLDEEVCPLDFENPEDLFQWA